MSTPPIAVAVLGGGAVAELLARRIDGRPELALAGVCASTEEPPSPTAVAVYLPTTAELAGGAAAERVTGLLRAGFDVVTTAPVEALADADLVGACREGGSTFHGTGGFQSSLATRFNRAFASITRDIRRVELVEELGVEEPPAHPWWSVEELGVGDGDAEGVAAHVAASEGYYDAGMHTLSEAVFGDARRGEQVRWSAARARGQEGSRKDRGPTRDGGDEVVVQRDLGAHVAYDSVWRRREGSSAPLRYRLRTETDDAVGQVTLTFHEEGALRPTDHLTAVGLLDAIVPVSASAPGVLRHDLDIYRVKPDERLAGR